MSFDYRNRYEAMAFQQRMNGVLPRRLHAVLVEGDKVYTVVVTERELAVAAY